jgi:thiamine biosynthesis lipoprotein
MMLRVYLAASPAGHGCLFCLGLSLVACLLGGCTSGRPECLVRVQEERRIMAAPWKITVYARDHETGRAAVAAALAEVERLEKVLSDYDPESELARLSASAPMPEPVEVSDDLWRVLVAAERLRQKSDGAFDIAVGPLTTLWRQARRSGKLPRADKLAAARAAIGDGAVELVAERQAVRLPRAGSRLDPGGIGRGYAADRALEILAARGIASALIDSSGDILVSGPPPGRAGWQIAVAALRPGGEGESVELAHAAVTTSGDAYQAVEIDGVRYSHIVDPRTGLGVAGPAAVTVIAPDATAADSLATAASVLGPAESKAFLGRFPGVAARFAWQDGKATRICVTPGWPNGEGAANCP